MLHLTSTDDAARLAKRALEFVEAEIGSLPSDAQLLDDFLFLMDHHDSYVKGLTWDGAYDFEKLRVKLRREVGAIEVAKRIVGLGNLGVLGEYQESLTMLRDGGVSQVSPFDDYENHWGERLNRTRKLFEFYVASGVRLSGGKVTSIAPGADDSQRNPDVLIEDFPLSGVACKVVSGKHIQTLIENIEKGSHQVAVSAADMGIVLLDVRNRIDTELLFPQTDATTYRTFRYAAHAEAVVQKLLGDLADEVLEATSAEWRQQRYEQTNCKAFGLIAQSCAVIETDAGPVPTLVGKGRIIPIVDGCDPELDDALRLARWVGDTVPMPELQ